MTPRLIIKVVERVTAGGEREQLTLQPGLNLIIGPSNSGKTRWIQMIDFLFGKDRSARAFFGDDIADKYVSVSAVVSLNGKDHKLERQWGSTEVSGVVFVDGKPVDAKHLSEFFLKGLSIPVLRFPRSRALADFAWVELGWRVLLRHIYRQEKYWADIADRQPPPEQHAAILQFLGLARSVFSRDAERYNELKRELLQAAARKAEFESIINEIAEGILADYHSNAGITEDLLDVVIAKLKQEMALLVENRTATLEQAVASQPKDGATSLSVVDVELGARRLELVSKIEMTAKEHETLFARVQRLEQTQATFEQELERLERARAAGDILVDLKVTHCPACDQKLHSTVERVDGKCYCCKQDYDYPSSGQRLSFEASQLREEYNESTGLLNTLRKQSNGLLRILEDAKDELRTVETNLQPARAKVAGFLPQEVAVIDVKRGKLDEKMSSAHRLKGMLRSRKDLSDTIDKMAAELKALESKLNSPDDPVKWQVSADKLADGINTYLGMVRLDSKPWNQGRATVKLSERYARFEVDGSDWNSKLGGNYRCIFLMAYHYSLLRLTSDPICHYPGLTIIDFPPNPAEQLGASKTLNYLLPPFIELLKRPEMEESQLIIASRELRQVEGANNITLTKQWV